MSQKEFPRGIPRANILFRQSKNIEHFDFFFFDKGKGFFFGKDDLLTRVQYRVSTARGYSHGWINVLWGEEKGVRNGKRTRD